MKQFFILSLLLSGLCYPYQLFAQFGNSKLLDTTSVWQKIEQKMLCLLLRHQKLRYSRRAVTL